MFIENPLLATGSTDKSVKITDYKTGEEKFVFTPHTGPVSLLLGQFINVYLYFILLFYFILFFIFYYLMPNN
jgi:WD40 repeat protein